MVAWLRSYPSVVRWCLREEFGTPSCTNPPRWRFPRWEYSGLEILHGGEGGDVELGARTSELIIVFAFNPLSLNSLFTFVHCIFHSYCHIIFACVVPCIYFILPYHLICLVCLCVPHLYLTNESFI